MIRSDGWSRRNIWEHSQSVLELYERRARGDAEEMDAHAQAAELLAARAAPGDTVLDAGCGTGYFLHALRRREIPVSYYGVDATAAFIRLGRQCLEPFGLAPDRLQCLRLEDMEAEMDHVVCINVLSNLDNYHRPLERLLASARKTLILRESLAESSLYSYVRDDYLDAGVDLRVHINHYGRQEILEFIRARGFDAELLTDRRTQGRPELVIGHPHHWTFVVADRRGGEVV